jgi:hypothetical protein
VDGRPLASAMAKVQGYSAAWLRNLVMEVDRALLLTRG